jgi:hypothetical protein
MISFIIGGVLGTLALIVLGAIGASLGVSILLGVLVWLFIWLAGVAGFFAAVGAFLDSL